MQTKTTEDPSRPVSTRSVGAARVGARPVTVTPRAESDGSPNAAGTYVADSFSGDIAATMGGTFALAHDGEPAGLARVTMAMRTPGRKESPAPRRLIGLCSWAAAIGILGTILAIRAAVAVMIGTPSWYLPTAGIIALFGILATMGSFLTARARVVPFALLGAATASLAGALIATLFAA